MSWNHNHQHGHSAHGYNRSFALGIVLNIIYIVVEAGYGLSVGSLALLADAAHNLSDVFGLVLAWGGYYLCQLKPNSRYTYGWRSSSIMAAFFNALLLLVAVGGISWEAIGRFSDPVEVPGFTIMIVAGIGVVINSITAVLFIRGQKEDINIRGAFLHMAADAVVSVGVVIGGLLTVLFGFGWIDPVLSLLIAVVIFGGTWGLLKDSTSLALQAVPPGIDPGVVTGFFSKQPEVAEIHDLHIWGISTRETALTCHLVIPKENDTDLFLRRMQTELHDRFGIEHMTIQIERDRDGGCPQAPDDVV